MLKPYSALIISAAKTALIATLAYASTTAAQGQRVDTAHAIAIFITSFVAKLGLKAYTSTNDVDHNNR